MNAAARFAEIDQLKARLDGLRPLPEHTVRTLHEQQALAWTYHSNAIEGNTLTLQETKVVLEGITIGGKSLREHFEVINHKEAIDYVEAIVSGREGCHASRSNLIPSGESRGEGNAHGARDASLSGAARASCALSEWQIKSIHQLVLKNIDDRNAGRYRQENVVIAGAGHLPPAFLKVPEAMAALMNDYQKAIHLHPVECAARLHADFVGIHPFVDGNGRTARLLMNFELMRRGYLPVIIQVEQRLAYYEALDTAHTRGDYRAFIELVASLEQAALQHHLRVILGEK